MTKRSSFQLGEKDIEPEAREALDSAGVPPAEVWTRHLTGDWSDLDEREQRENAHMRKQALNRSDLPFVSVWTLSTGFKIEVRTEPDESKTVVRRAPLGH